MALTNAGRNIVAQLIIGSGSPQNFDTTHAYLGVGDSTTAFSASHTDLQAATNKFRQLVKQAPGIATNVLTFVSDFSTSDGNYAWQEIGVFNAAAAGTMLCRVVQSLGTKASGVWTLTHTVTVTAP
jgi:hypothetical protein